jgi:futalosine hydrolase
MLLVCAATDFELAAFPDNAGPELIRAVSGVGIAATLLGLRLPDGPRPELILNIGIAGVYPGTGMEIGDVVLADGETWGDVGFELPEEPGFRPVTESPFGGWYAEPLPTVRPGEWYLPNAHVARGCTVNCCTGTEETGIRRRDRFGAGFETMEGAAVAALGRAWGIPVCEVRAISNIAGRRDMRPENIRRALDSLRRYLETCRARTA